MVTSNEAERESDGPDRQDGSGYFTVVETFEGHSLPSQQEIPATHTTVIAHVTDGRQRPCSSRPTTERI